MASIDELEARLAELEARLPTPRAAAPPVTIGELVDVPAPGAPIASAWAQEVTNRAVHRFATVAAMNAWAAANGSIACVLTATPGLEAWYVRSKATWVQFAGNLPWGTYTLQGATSIADGTNQILRWVAGSGSVIPVNGDGSGIVVPARGWYRVDYTASFGSPPAGGIRAAWFDIGDTIRRANTGAPASASGGTALSAGIDLLIAAAGVIAVSAFVAGAGAAVPMATGAGGTVATVRMLHGVAP